MEKEYESIFKALIQAYYSGNFEKKVEEIIVSSGKDKDEITAIVSSACGVNVKYSNNFTENLKDAILNYKKSSNIINKIKPCDTKCIDKDGTTPCKRSCPLGAIVVDRDKNDTYINNDLCIECGFCVDACPSGSLKDKVEFLPFAPLIKENKTVIAAVAPAIIGQFGENVTIDKLRTAFKVIGFTDMVEVAFFADILTLKEATEFDHHVKKIDDFMITSCCCPMWVGMLKKVYKDLVTHVSPSVSPMIAAGRVMKYLNPNCKVVFIGPCIAKKAEAKDKDIFDAIDYVLTFEELKTIFEALNIDVEKLPEDHSSEYASRGGRLYGRTGGVSIAVGEAIERMFPDKFVDFSATQANGVKECKEMLNKAQKGEIRANFIEGMGCVGGCVGGPKAIIPKESGTQYVNNLAEESSIKVAVDSSCMKEILKKLDINSEKDFKDSVKIEMFEREFNLVN